MSSTATPVPSLLDRIGFSTAFGAGFLGLLIFMIGDGVDAGFIAPFMVEHGANSIPRAGYVITTYGLFVLVGSFLAGPLSNVYGPRAVMCAGAAIFILCDVGFLLWAVPSQNYSTMFVFYGVRGLAYPLFSLGFLSWLMAATPVERRGVVSGWFYVGFVGGLCLGPFVATIAINNIGQVGALWIGAIGVALGTMIMYFGVRETQARDAMKGSGEGVIAAIKDTVSLGKSNPRIVVASIARVINNGPIWGMLVFLPPIFAVELGYGITGFLAVVSTTLGVCTILNPLGGLIGDRFGWRVTSATGAVLVAITFGIFYFVPVTFGNDRLWVALICGGILGAALALQVPLSPLVYAMAPNNVGGGAAFLGLGTGGANLIGPLIASSMLPWIGASGVIILFVILYLVQFGLILTLKTPAELESSTDIDTDKVPS